MAGIIKESEDLLHNIREWHAEASLTLSEKDDIGYGHALRLMGAQVEDHQEDPPEVQKSFLREKALQMIEKYGDNIKKVMKSELLEALGIQDD